MKVAVITDMHLGCRSDSSIFLQNQERFFSEIFFPKIDELDIKVVLDLGDTFDRRKFVNYMTLHESKRFFFNELAKRRISYHAIVGNHSTYYKNTNDVNSMELLLGEYENFHVYADKPVLLTFDSSKIMMVPWLTKENEEASLRYIDKVEADVLAGHFDIVGFEMMRGSICDHGLDRRVFDKFETVWSGHFHHPSKHANIEYLGAPYEMTWTDHNGTRGFHIFDTETRTLTRVHNPYRMFNKITYHDADLTIEEINDLDPSPLKGTYVKIVVAAKTNPYLFELFVNKIQAADPVDVKIVEDNFNLENLSEEEIIDEAMGTREAFFDYIDNVLPDSVGDKEAIKKLMDELYVEALNL